MIYRVIWKISYYENWFDFDNIEDAGAFAESVLRHCVPNEDRKKEPMYITIHVIDPERMNKEDEE